MIIVWSHRWRSWSSRSTSWTSAVDPSCSTRIGEEQQRQQAGDFRLVGKQADKGAGKADRGVAEFTADQAGAGACLVSLGEDQEDDSQDGLQAVSLPLRQKLFDSIGARGMSLTAPTETPLDDLHTLAETTWSVRFGPDARSAEPLEFGATFLLRLDGRRWRIVVYLNHHDVVASVESRADAQPGRCL